MKTDKKPVIKEELLGWGKTIAIAVGLAFIVRTFLFEPVTVDGKSMQSTLQNGDKMVVSKIGEPERFDIIVFHATDKDDYVKRVIGLPGDNIEYKDDKLYINGKEYKEPYLDKKKEEVYKKFGKDANLTIDFNLKELLGTDKVPNDTLFVLGDNRRNSADSRIIGFIPMDTVVGKSKAIYFPIKDIQLLNKSE